MRFLAELSLERALATEGRTAFMSLDALTVLRFLSKNFPVPLEKSPILFSR